MHGGSHSEMLFTEILGGAGRGGWRRVEGVGCRACGRNQRIKVPDSLECAGSDICVGALTPLIHLSQGA